MLEKNVLYKERGKEKSITDSIINNVIENLTLYTTNIEMLTKLYTEVFMDDNVMYILTRISQNPVFAEHFPEFYVKNKYGESVINCQQNTKYHKYGVFKHILSTIENVGKGNNRFNKEEMKILKWTMFLHDIGKPRAKTINASGSDSFAGHEDISYEIAIKILDRFSFTDNEKHIILTLIKYHDKFLNEGELTYDNLSFLSSELDNDERLFELLIEVKLADNKAKSIDVYNNFAITKNKYYQFADLYFKNKGNAKEMENDLEADDEIKDQMDEDEILVICNEMMEGKYLKPQYLPIVDLKNKKVHGYESNIRMSKNVNVTYRQILRKSKMVNIYDKFRQAIFLNTLHFFEQEKLAKSVEKYVNIDLNSYKKCIQNDEFLAKIKDKKIVLVFDNFEIMKEKNFKEELKKLRKWKIKTCIDEISFSNESFGILDELGISFVKYKLKDLEQNSIEKVKELQTFCLAKNISLIVTDVNSKDKLSFLLDVKVRYVQGDYLVKKIKTPSESNNSIKNIITNLQEDKII